MPINRNPARPVPRIEGTGIVRTTIPSPAYDRYAKAKIKAKKYVNKLQFDIDDNIAYNMKINSYEVNITSDKEASKYDMLREHGNFYSDKERISPDQRKGAINVYRHNFIDIERIFGDNNREQVLFKWYVPLSHIPKKEIYSILTGKVFYYILHISVRKFGIELINFCSSTRHYPNKKIRNIDPMPDIIKHINENIESAMHHAKKREHSIFNSPLNFDGDEEFPPSPDADEREDF